MAFGNGGLALGLAAAVVEVDPVRLKGVTEIGPRGEHSVLTAADAEATDGIGGSLRDAFQLKFYHGFYFWGSSEVRKFGSSVKCLSFYFGGSSEVRKSGSSVITLAGVLRYCQPFDRTSVLPDFCTSELPDF